MASIEELPADQRAVLQMVLARGRTYDQIAAVLSIDRDAVRRRALDGAAALTPDGLRPGREQALVTDYLLSQLTEPLAQEVHAYLESAPEDREWARAISATLEQIANTPLPEIPVAAPLRSDQPAAAHEPERPGPPNRKPRRPPFAPATRRPHNARLLAALGVAVAILAAGAVVLASAGGSSKSAPGRTGAHTRSTGGTSTTGTTTADSGPQILAALNLTSPAGASQTIGVAQVVRDSGVIGIVIDAQGVPANSTRNAYGLWLYNSATSEEFVGFDPNLVRKNGKLAIEGTLPANASKFRRLLITLETRQHPKTPGEVVLSGPFRETKRPVHSP